MAAKKQTKKELTLSKDKKLMGVAGGIAKYFNADPAWVRIIALIFIVLTGIVPGMLIYFIIGATIMPEKRSTKK